MRKLFEGTPTAALEPVMRSEHTAILLGKELRLLKGVVELCKKYEWLTPLGRAPSPLISKSRCVFLSVLVGMFEDRTLSMEFITEVTAYPSLEHIYAETVRLMETHSVALSRSLDHSLMALSASLDFISSPSSSSRPQQQQNETTEEKSD